MFSTGERARRDGYCSKSHLGGCPVETARLQTGLPEEGVALCNQLRSPGQEHGILECRLPYGVKRDVNSGCSSAFSEEALASEGAQCPTLANSFKCLKLHGTDLGLSDLPLPCESSSDPVGPLSWSPVSAFIIAFQFPCCVRQRTFALQKFKPPQHNKACFLFFMKVKDLFTAPNCLINCPLNI